MFKKDNSLKLLILINLCEGHALLEVIASVVLHLCTIY